jgi:hypothetical protein
MSHPTASGHAVNIWADPTLANTIFVEAEGEILTFPANEPGRLVAWLRQRALNSVPQRKALRDPEREKRALEWNEAWKAKAEEVRQEHEAREERKRERGAKRQRGLIRRANKAHASKEADEFFKELGL